MELPPWKSVLPDEPPKIPSWTYDYAQQMKEDYESRVERRENDPNIKIERGSNRKTEEHLNEERKIKILSSVINFKGELRAGNDTAASGENIVVCNKYLREMLNEEIRDHGISEKDNQRFRRFCRKESVYSLSIENFRTLMRRFALAREQGNSNFEAIRSNRFQEPPVNHQNDSFNGFRNERSRMSSGAQGFDPRSRSPQRRNPSPIRRPTSPAGMPRTPMPRSNISPSRRNDRNRLSPGPDSYIPRSKSPATKYGSPIRRPRSPIQKSRSPKREFRSPVCSSRSRSPVPSSRSPVRRMRSPARRSRSPARRPRSPARRSRSPARRPRSPARRSRSPVQSSRSPARRPRSPARRSKSPLRRPRSPAGRQMSRSPRRRSNISPDRRYINID